MKITFTTSNGKSVVFAADKIRLFDIQGTGHVAVETQTQKAPFQDGRSLIDSVIDMRMLTLDFGLFASEESELYELRREVSSVLNPKLGEGVLRIEYSGGVKEIFATPDGSPTFLSGSSNQTSKFQRATVDLICPLPFWLDITTISEPLVAWLGKFEFPLSFPMEFGAQGDSRILTNEGDVSTPVIIEFRGPAQNPVVTNNTTGEFICVNRTLVDGDRLVIDTAFGQKRVEIINDDGTTTNVFNWIDLDSTFFQLIPGDNDIEYNATSGKDTAVVTLHWRNRYVGI